MERFFSSFHLDRLSFWVGFVGGGLFFWLISKLRAIAPTLRIKISNQIQSSQKGLFTNVEYQYRNTILINSQMLHLASPLFALDEILIPPRLMAPPMTIEPDRPPIYEDITTQVIPYIPDWPELAATFVAPTLLLEEALQGNNNYVILGHPGSGKTVSLAHLAIRLARREIKNISIGSFLPLILHVADLDLQTYHREDPLALFIETAIQNNPLQNQKRLRSLLTTSAMEGRLLLLLDGLDELTPEGFDEIASILENLINACPKIRAITTATFGYLGSLPKIGFTPLSMSAWSNRQKQIFIKRWHKAWTQTFKETSNTLEDILEIINAWLLNENKYQTPLEITLEIWSAYAGDTLGSTSSHSIESYLNRIWADIPNASQTSRQIALAMVYYDIPFIAKDDNRIDEFVDVVINRLVSANANTSEKEIQKNQIIKKNIKASRTIPDLINCGLMRLYARSKTSFIHPVITSFLCGSALSENINIIDMHLFVGQHTELRWTTKTDAIMYLASKKDISPIAIEISSRSTDPLQKETLLLARWLRISPENYLWQDTLLRMLVNTVNDDNLTLALRTKALSAVVVSKRQGIDLLIRQLVDSNKIILRQLGILGMGLLGDPNFVIDLTRSIGDSIAVITRASCLALVEIGTKSAIDLVASTLVNGSEEARRAAAEALANNKDVGHELIKEASSLDDILVRRAAIFGLRRIKENWAIETLRRMQVEDNQWVVKNAADQALEEIDKPNPWIPTKVPLIYEIPWLISFAGERGKGLSPGSNSLEMVLLTLKEGKEEQKLAALDIIRKIGDPHYIDIIYQIYNTSYGDVKETAYNNLWWLSLTTQTPGLSPRSLK